MNEIYISDPLHQHLTNKRPVHIIGGIHHEEHEAYLSGKRSDFVLPPLNTHINFLKYTQTYSDQDHLDLHLKYSATDNNLVGVCVFITAGPMIKLCPGGEGDSEGHVL